MRRAERPQKVAQVFTQPVEVVLGIFLIGAGEIFLFKLALPGPDVFEQLGHLRLIQIGADLVNQRPEPGLDALQRQQQLPAPVPHRVSVERGRAVGLDLLQERGVERQFFPPVPVQHGPQSLLEYLFLGAAEFDIVVHIPADQPVEPVIEKGVAASREQQQGEQDGGQSCGQRH